MFQLLKSTLALLVLGASAMSVSGAAPLPQQVCGQCEGIADPVFLEFSPKQFPDDSICMVRHNFTVKDGECTLQENQSGQAECLPTPDKGCKAEFTVICLGNGCVDASGAPRVLHGSFLQANGVLIAITQTPLACGQTFELGRLPCNSKFQICNAVVWITCPPPNNVEFRCTTLKCETCTDAAGGDV